MKENELEKNTTETVSVLASSWILFIAHTKNICQKMIGDAYREVHCTVNYSLDQKQMPLIAGRECLRDYNSIAVFHFSVKF